MKEIDNKLTQKFDEYPSFGVLKGVKVFVTGTNIAGPFAGCLMAEMGAKVLQAEAPTIACQTRGTLAWSQNHRNEYSITINTASAAGKKIFLKCIEWADIWIEAGRPGSYAKRGLTDEVCWKHNKKLAIVHVSGYGQFGHGRSPGPAQHQIGPLIRRGHIFDKRRHARSVDTVRPIPGKHALQIERAGLMPDFDPGLRQPFQAGEDHGIDGFRPLAAAHDQ